MGSRREALGNAASEAQRLLNDGVREVRACGCAATCWVCS